MELKFLNNWRWTDYYACFVLFNVWYNSQIGVGGFIVCNFGVECVFKNSPLHSTNVFRGGVISIKDGR